MNIGQLLGGAGVVGRGMRAGEDAERTARQNQLIIEEQNRAADLTQQLAGLQMQSFRPITVAQYAPQIMPGATMPMGAVPAASGAAPAAPTPAAPTPGVAATAAPAAPAVPAAPGVATAPVASQPMIQSRTLPPVQPDMSQSQADRLALLRAPTAILDVAQAPVAAGLNLFGMGVAGAQNLAGRVVNAVTGETTLPTDTQYRQFSMTPFYDRYVREPEQAATDAAQARQRGTLPPTPAAQLPNPQQLLQAMIRVESAGKPGAVSGKGAVGLMQVLPSTAMKPGFDLPNVFDFAEQMGAQVGKRSEAEAKRLLADPTVGAGYGQRYMDAMLQRYNGNLEYALAAYNAGPKRVDKWLAAGADFNKLPEETRAYIPKVLAAYNAKPGAAPAAPAAAAAPGAAPTPLEVPQTQARNMEMAEFYLADPESIPYELQQVNQMAQQQAALLTQQRNEAAQLAQVYMRSGTQKGTDAAMRLRDNIGQLDASLLQLQQQVGQKQMYLQGMQGLRELATANDPRRLSGVLTQFMGTPVGIQPRPDGKYNYFLNGKKVQDGVSPAQLAAMALREFSPEARTASAQSAQLENELALKRKYGDALVNAMRDIQKAMVDGEYKLADRHAAQLEGKLTVDSSKGVAYLQKGNRVFVINPDSISEETPFGKIELPPTARRVGGIDVGR
jgi:soluble lytic murein transglycosylase-like protein